MVILQMSLYATHDFEGKSQKTAFSKRAAIGSGRKWNGLLWSYFDEEMVNFD